MSRRPRRRKSLPAFAGPACIEAMEKRLLFSSALTPAQLRHFYGVDTISFNGVAGTGAGQTIAIVDAYDQPDLLDSTDPNFASSDLHQFDVLFGLPDPPSFTKIDENGGTNIPTQHVTAWSEEETLDVEWTHAMAPMANIVLVECASASDGDLVQAGVQAAQNYPGVTVISMSFNEGEPSNIVSQDSLFSSTTGITYVASAGDNGAYSPDYPAASSYVLGVGGTSITLADTTGTYGSEVVWNSNNGLATGGEPSSYEPRPAYQANIGQDGTTRDIPDVAFDADPATGVYIYDSAESSQHHGYLAGGTSLGAPAWAGLIAIADQGRALEGLGSLTGFSQTLPRLYSLSPNDFHDITSGNNSGFSAGPGYDLTTGIGTPIANQLVPDLAGGDTITGRLFIDNHGSTTYSGSDTPVSGQTVYLDLSNSGVYAAGDPTAVTNASGIYTFTDLIGSLTGTVRLQSPPTGYYVISADTTFTTSYGGAQTVNFSLFPTVYSTTNPTTNFTLNLDSSGATEQILINGVVTYSVEASLVPYMAFSFTGTIDSLTVDGTDGNPVPGGGITLSGASTGSLLTVIGTPGSNDAFEVTGNSIAFDSDPITFTNVSQLMLNPSTGDDALLVDSGQVIIPAQLPGAGILTRQFSTLSVSSGATAIFATAPLHSDRTVVEATTLAIAGKLDLGGNDMIIHNGDLTATTALLASGFAGGTWSGLGIDSSAAAADTRHLTALGILANTTSLYSSQNLFDGLAPLPTDLLIKYTYYGDANLDGKVDGSDYSRIDSAVLFKQTGWFNGDFNFDGAVNGSDYTLMDNAFNTQGKMM